MTTFIKTGFWQNSAKGNKEWFDVDHLIKGYIDSRATGGVKSWFFTTTPSDIPNCYVAQTAIPNDGVQSIPVSIGGGETVIAQFLTPLDTPEYRVTEGMRFFYFTARASSTSKRVQLIGEVWLTDLDGLNGTLLRTSSISMPLTLVDAAYITSVHGNTVFIDHTTTRVMFKVIAVKESGGPNITVTLSVNDNTYSRLDVPSPVGVTEMVVVADENVATIYKVGKLRYHTTANTSSLEMCMQTGASTYEWVVIKQNSW